MQIAAHVANAPSSLSATSPFADYKVIRRNGAVVSFEPPKMSVAVTKGFLAVEGGQGAASARIRELVGALTGVLVRASMPRQEGGGTFHIEDIQDQVESALMCSGEHEVTSRYVHYRQKRVETHPSEAVQLNVTTGAGAKKSYHRHVHFQQIGIDQLRTGATTPFPWMSELIDLKRARNFFETRGIEYQTGEEFSWD